MSADSFAALPPPRHEREELAFGAVVLLAIAVSAFALASGHERLAIVASVLPIAGWFTTRPTSPLILLGASIPALMSLTGNSLGSTGNGGYNASISDFLLLLIGAGIVFRWLSGRSE